MQLTRAIDRERLRRWWLSPEGAVMRRWVERRLLSAGEFLSNESLDLSLPANQTKASRMQGECRPLRFLLESDKLLDELEGIAEGFRL
jgi:hypothetical protein